MLFRSIGAWGLYNTLAGRQSLSSKANARKNPNNPSQDEPWFTQGWYDCQNGIFKDYTWFIGYTFNDWIYSTLFSYERFYCAAPDRKRLLFLWSQAVIPGAGFSIENITQGYSVTFDNLDGHIIQLYGHGYTPVPVHWAIWSSFFSHMYGQGLYAWGERGGFSRNLSDLPNNPQSFYNAQTKWKKNGQPLQDYNSGDSSQPFLNGNGAFPHGSYIGEDGFVVGSYLYSQIRLRQTTLEYASFSVNNGAYYNPVAGTNGTQVSRFGSPNYGQHNIVNLAEQKKPICLVGNGSEGMCIIYLNPLLLAIHTENVKVNYNSITYDLGSIKGGDLAVFTI